MRIKSMFLVLSVFFISGAARAGDIDFPSICEGYEDHKEPISVQHRYVKRLDKLSCRLSFRIHEMPWLYLTQRGLKARNLVKRYRKAIKDLQKCTQFNYENTREDRVFACYGQMDAAYATLFRLSDHLEHMMNIITLESHHVLVHNRRALDIIMGQTKYDRPKRSWYDFGKPIRP